MKVMVLTPYYPPHLGGVQVYARSLALALAGLGCEVVVVTSGPRAEVTQDGPLTVHRLVPAVTVSNTPLALSWFSQVRRLIRQERPDVVNAHTPVPFLVDVAAWVRGPVPLVVTYHAMSLLKANSPGFNLLAAGYARAERATLRRADTVLAVSDAVADMLRRRGVAARVETVPNSIVVPDERPARPLRQGLSAELVFVSSLDRSHDWKGLPAVIAAVADGGAGGGGDGGRGDDGGGDGGDDGGRGDDGGADGGDGGGDGDDGGSGSPLRLTVIGDGSERPRYEGLVRSLGIKDRVRFVGAQFGATKDESIREADLLVVYPTTANDAFPTVILEAWAQGTPVIASDVGPMRSILRDGVDSVLAPAGDPAALRAVIYATVADPARCARLSDAGFERLRDQHDWAVNARRTLAIFGEVVDRSRTRTARL